MNEIIGGGNGNKETFFDSLSSVEFAGNNISVETYLQDANRNLLAMSRTARGVVDTSASAEKAKSMTDISGETAADLAKQNFETAIREAYDKKEKNFESPEDLRSFIEGLATTVNSGIVKEGNLIRTSDSEKYPYARIANLENYMNKFYQELYDRIQNPEADPIEAAAFAEFGIDFGGHFFADGCGKTAKIVSSYILMRHNHKLPEYKGGRDAYYANQLQQIAGENEAADEAGYQKFLKYYRGLF
ncbi:Fic family protein [Candidatus Saccharibacteria bacterium]|nr:Fic family protein [Candidatus Saccharibacteria bacterium]